MGNTNSIALPDEEKQSLKGKKAMKRKYKVPDVRERDRFEPANNSNNANIFEASIDKYDYLIVFPKTEGPFVHFSTKEAKRKISESDAQFIKWDTIKELWKQAVPGTDSTKDAAVDALATYWKKRTGSFPQEAQEIRVIPWLTIAREAIIDQLSTRSGLQLKLTANATNIFCRIRAPIKLLEQQAAKIHYRLQLKPEIDPGSEKFWNVVIRGKPVELDEEKKIYTKDKANEILQNLYRAGKISPSDLGVDETKETQVVWSRRVHALERIADQVPVYNDYVTYAAFSNEKHLRYLYQTYPSVRGKTLFRAKDRLYLTKSIIDKYFDCEVLADQSRGTMPVISDILALHDANRGELQTIDSLQRRWVTFWRTTAKESGAPYVSHPAYEVDEEVDWYLRPISLPLSEIRDYFGEKIGLHYAWFGYYVFYLLFAAFLGLTLEIIIAVRGYVDTDGNYDYPTLVILFLIMMWGTIYHSNWDVEENIIALKWGTVNMTEDDNTDRPQFRPDPEQPTIRSVVNNRLITNFPKYKREGRQILTMAAVFLCIVIDLGLIGLLFALDIEVFSKSSITWLPWVVAFLQAALIKIGTFLYRPWAKLLTNYENHRSETDYEENLVFKTVLFEIFNSYAALFYTAFIKGYIYDGCSSSSCIGDLRQLLIAIVVVRVTMSIVDLFSPFLRRVWMEYFNPSKLAAVAKDSEGLLAAAANDDLDENTDYMLEIDRGYYDGAFSDYAHGVFQYGYLMLFLSALPMLPLLTLLENVIKMRTDGLKLCSIVRRPHVQLAEKVGTWSILMEIMSYIGVITTVGILVFTTTDFSNYSTSQKAIIFLTTQQVVIVIKLFIRALFSNKPQWVKDIAARHKYIEDKYVKGYEDEDVGFDLNSGLNKGVLEDTIDVDGMNLYDLRKGVHISEEEYKEIEKLEARRRDLNRELRYAKDKLLEVYKAETYNENTGVGETKHGLPLGRLSVKVLEIQNLPVDHDIIPPDLPIKVRVTIKSTRKGITNAGPPIGPLSDTSVFKLSDGNVAINQSLGPFAPIRTQDADVVFDVLDMSTKNNEASVATTSIKLRDLQDQLSHDSVLHLAVRTVNPAVLSKSDAKLFVTLKFEYSKVVPLRNKIYGVQDKLRQVEKKLAIMKSGRKVEEESEV